MCILLAFPDVEGVPVTYPLESNVSLSPSEPFTFLNLVKASMQTFKVMAGECGEKCLK